MRKPICIPVHHTGNNTGHHDGSCRTNGTPGDHVTEPVHTEIQARACGDHHNHRGQHVGPAPDHGTGRGGCHQRGGYHQRAGTGDVAGRIRIRHLGNAGMQRHRWPGPRDDQFDRFGTGSRTRDRAHHRHRPRQRSVPYGEDHRNDCRPHRDEYRPEDLREAGNHRGIHPVRSDPVTDHTIGQDWSTVPGDHHSDGHHQDQQRPGSTHTSVLRTHVVHAGQRTLSER